MSLIIEDRASAGRELAQALAKYRSRDNVIVLALPRGGVPVGAAIAHALCAPLDIPLVRKLGTPGHEELAMGAIASGGMRVLNRGIIEELNTSRAGRAARLPDSARAGARSRRICPRQRQQPFQ